MLTLTVQPNCDHAPKKAFLRDFLVAFVEADTDYLISCVTDDITWEVIGDARIVGKVAFMTTVNRLNPHRTVELTINQIIIEGKEAAVSGKFTLATEDRYAFADVYIFNDAKGDAIQMIKSFNIKLG